MNEVKIINFHVGYMDITLSDYITQQLNNDYELISSHTLVYNGINNYLVCLIFKIK